MFAKSIGVFILLLACLGLGVAWVIERETGADLLPNQHTYITNYKIRSVYLSNKIKLQYWWERLTGTKQNKMISIRHEGVDPKQPRIVKWQDEQGVWHYQYDKSQPPSAP